jgi:hypothetical protein
MSKFVILFLVSLSAVAVTLVNCQAPSVSKDEVSASDEADLELALVSQVRRGLLAQLLLKQRLAEANEDGDEEAGEPEKRASKYRTGNTRNKVSQLHSNGHFDGAAYRKVLAEKNQMYQNLLG